MKYAVVTENGAGELVPLRGTIWALHMERAQLFETKEAAQAALDKAKKFMKAATYKKARIMDIEQS